MLFARFSTDRGCQSYLLGCERRCAGVVIDPEDSLEEQYLSRSAQLGIHIQYALDTHTHADHFSGTVELARALNVPVVMHRSSPAPFVSMPVDDGEQLHVGDLALNVLYTPGHTADSMCILVDGRVFTGDTLLIGSCGRTDLPSGDAEALYDSLFGRLLLLDAATEVYPAHVYGERNVTTIGDEIAGNARLKLRDRFEFVEQMHGLNLREPDHLTEALRTNLSGGRTVQQLIAEAGQRISFMSMVEVRRRLALQDPGIILLDVRERDAYERSHIPGAMHIPRGQLELRVNEQLPDPTQRLVVYCQLGQISTLATATLRKMGYSRAVALSDGFRAWCEEGHPVE
jgi:glyoxylase-like metal-dependent hydrolase (beta-lactamase superfamily II)/rhodanese-related sulfurtransferase